MRREGTPAMEPDSWGVPAPGLAASALHIKQLAPGERGSVPPGKSVTGKPGGDLLPPGYGVVRTRSEGLQFCKECFGLRTSHVSGARH